MIALFLDIDGVLNSSEDIGWHPDAPGKRLGISGKLLDNLVWLLHQVPDLKVVISSVWRFNGIGAGSYLDLALRHYTNGEVVLKRVVGRTPRPSEVEEFWYCTRGQEIEYFIERWASEPITAMIVIDDNPVTPLEKYWVETDSRVGFTTEKAVEALKLLRKQITSNDGNITEDAG